MVRRINLLMLISGTLGLILVITLQWFSLQGLLPNCILCQYQRLCLLGISVFLLTGSLWWGAKNLMIILSFSLAFIGLSIGFKQLIMQITTQFDQLVVLGRLLERNKSLETEIISSMQQIYGLVWLLRSFAFWNVLLMSSFAFICVQYLLREFANYYRSLIKVPALIIAFGLCLNSSFAKDFGTYGSSFKIQEPSLLEYIQAKLLQMAEQGVLEGQQKLLEAQARKGISRPRSVTGITKTTNPRSFIYDPRITTTRDYADDKGKVFAHKGTQISPLRLVKWSQDLLFIDGDDKEQVELAFNDVNNQPKVILVQGEPLTLMESYQVPVYFDQGGFLVKKLGITQVPARVSAQGEVLLIEEFKISSNTISSN